MSAACATDGGEAARTLRIAAQIERAQAPVVVLWGPPGLGKQQLLKDLLRHDDGAEVPRSALAPAKIGQALRRARAQGHRCFAVAYGLPSGVAAQDLESVVGNWLDELRQNERLLLAITAPPALTEDRPLVHVLGPEELLLRREEVESLGWFAKNDRQRLSAKRAWEESRGWWRALEMLRDAPPDTRLRDYEPWKAFLAGRAASQVGSLLPPGAAEDRSPHAVPRGEAGRPRAFGSPTETIGRATWQGELAPSHRLELRTLGPPELHRHERKASSEDWQVERIHPPHRRVMILLAALATGSGRQRHRDELLEMLWPEYDMDRALGNLRPTLSLTRRLLRREPAGERDASAIVRRGAAYALSGDVAWWIDVEEFTAEVEATRPTAQAENPASADRSASEGEPADEDVTSALLERPRDELIGLRDRLQDAWHLYRGLFLSGMAVTPWVRDERSRLEELWDEMLLRLAAVHAALGEEDRALDAYRSILSADATREDVHLEMMRIYGRQGRPDLVRRQYDRLCQHLLQEADARPLDSTARAYYALLSST